MANRIRRVDYFHTVIPDQPGEAYRLLAQLAELGTNLLAITAVPVGPTRTQLTVIPEDTRGLTDQAAKAGLELDGPHPALLVQGDDELGALATVHEQLSQAKVNVYASAGVSDGAGTYGYVIYVRPEEYERAAEALGI